MVSTVDFLTMLVTESDCRLPCIYPFTGKLSNSAYIGVSEILHGLYCSKKHSGVNSKDTLKCIRDHLSVCLQSPVKNKKTGLTYVNSVKRNSRSSTFDSTVVRMISDRIMPCILSAASKQLIPPEKILIDPSHGDLIYYAPGCFFAEHRDQVNKHPKEIDDPENWRMYSLIISIDSHITSAWEGATQVLLPSREWVIDGRELSSRSNRRMMPHIYTQSCVPMHFVIFPSEALHSSVKINNGFKLALKLDLWLKIPQLRADKINILSIQSFVDECTCDMCDRRYYRLEQASDSIKNILPRFHVDILMIIADYGVDKKSERKECICNYEKPYDSECQCTCVECYHHEATFNDYDRDDDPGDDYYPIERDDDECNGYQYDDDRSD